MVWGRPVRGSRTRALVPGPLQASLGFKDLKYEPLKDGQRTTLGLRAKNCGAMFPAFGTHWQRKPRYQGVEATCPSPKRKQWRRCTV